MICLTYLHDTYLARTAFDGFVAEGAMLSCRLAFKLFAAAIVNFDLYFAFTAKRKEEEQVFIAKSNGMVWMLETSLHPEEEAQSIQRLNLRRSIVLK